MSERILFFAPYSGPADVPLCEALSLAGFEVVYACSGPSIRSGLSDFAKIHHQAFTEKAPANSLVGRAAARFARKARASKVASWLRGLAQSAKPDLVVAGDIELGVPLALELGLPVFGLSHGSDVFEVPERSPKQGRQIRESLRACRGVLALSEFHAARIRELVAEVSFVVFAPMVDCEVFAPSETSQEDDLPRVLSLRGERAVYQPDVIKETLGLIDALLPIEARVRFSDDFALAKGRVPKVTKPIDHQEMPSEYARASLVLQSIERESLGYTTLEAMAAGRPIVQLDTPIARELLPKEQHTFLVACHAPDRAAQLAAKSLELLRDADMRKSLGQSNRAWALAHYERAKMMAVASSHLGVFLRAE